MSEAHEEDDGGVNGARTVETIVFEIIDQFRSVGRPLRFYEVEEKLLNGLKKLRLPAENLEKEKGLLRERLESLGSEKGALEVELRKMRDCMELSGVFSRLGWSGGVDVTERSAEEIYEKMLSKLMSGNGDDLSEVVDHLMRKMERLEGENADLKRKGDRGLREVGELRRKVEGWEKENAMMRMKVERGSRDAMELRKVKEELALANAKLNVKEESTMANVKLKVKAEGNSLDFIELSSKVELLEAENKDLKAKLEQNVAKFKWRTVFTEQYVSLKKELDDRKKICADLKNDKGILEKKNEAMQGDFDKLAQKNGKTCFAGNGDRNGKHCEVIGTVLSVENRRNDVIFSTALPTGNTTPISGVLVDLMDRDNDDDTALAGCLAKNKHSQNSLDKELLLSSKSQLKRKSVTLIDLTENNEENKKKGDDFCRSSSWMPNNKRSNVGLGEKLDRSPQDSSGLAI